MALKAVRTVAVPKDKTSFVKSSLPAVASFDIDLKQWARIEKIPGGEIEESEVLDGVMVNKDVLHPQMRRRIEKPRIVLLDCPLEYRKGESQTAMELSGAADWQQALELEEQQIREQCQQLLAIAKPDLVICEKGVSDLAQHYFVQAGVTALRRLRKTDMNRLARTTGATIVTRIEDMREADVGTGCGLYEVRKIGDEYFSFFTECVAPRACTILLRGPSKDILGEIERNLHDAMYATRNLFLDARLVPGGGASETALAVHLEKTARAIEGVERWPYQAAGQALEVIPRTLIQNAGGDVVRLLGELKAKHAAGDNASWGIDGIKACLVDQVASGAHGGVWETLTVKSQTIKTAIESACMILRVDDIVSGVSQKQASNHGMPSEATAEDMQARD